MRETHGQPREDALEAAGDDIPACSTLLDSRKALRHKQQTVLCSGGKIR